MKTIWFSLGTSAELIKVYPLIIEATKRNWRWLAFSTAQSPINLTQQWRDFQLPPSKLISLFERNRDLHRSAEALSWFLQSFYLGPSRLIEILQKARFWPLQGEKPLWLVHGDTLSTVLGARYGKKLGLPVAHLEAGLRSPKILNPFPEELNRRWVSTVADFHLCQDDKAVQNIKKTKTTGKIINTGANTLFDSIQEVLENFSPPPRMDRARPLVVANIHRFENLHSKKRWKMIVEILVETAARYSVLLILHPQTQAQLEADIAAKAALDKAGVELSPRLPFTQFIHLIDEAEFLISDGGSNQEECFYLGKPCLILRLSTERQEGLDAGVCVLSRFDPTIIHRFLNNPKSYKMSRFEPAKSPTQIIFDAFDPQVELKPYEFVARKNIDRHPDL